SKLLAVGSPFFWQWKHPPLAVGTYTASGNSLLANKYKENLVGILHETGSKEVVIVCHGYRSCKDRIPMVNIATGFANEGISAFRFDFAGNDFTTEKLTITSFAKSISDSEEVSEESFKQAVGTGELAVGIGDSTVSVSICSAEGLNVEAVEL
nr:alpha/beta hydrolases superfamily protein [Tanacetum cinerariifolium]